MENQGMRTVEEHYEQLLAQVYTWMGGGLTQKVKDNRRFFQELGLAPKGCGKALDLGCGSGFQTLALASLGFNVVGIDTNEALLTELRANSDSDRIKTVKSDMRDTGAYESFGPFEVAVCMGDTLVHLRSYDEVASCMAALRRSIEPGGRLIVSFRDLTFELKGVDRVIPVRMDDERLLATFLEYEPENVVVHDIVFDRGGGTWEMRKSAYRKLRLAPTKFAVLLAELGFQNVRQTTERGLWTTMAQA
jgi:SAM-dependent methyltransferase